MEFKKMIKNKLIQFGTALVATVVISVSAQVNDNPFRNSLEITQKYLPKALKSMWQREYLVWRAQLFNSACSEKKLGVSGVINSSFGLFNQYIIDQAIMNKELANDNEQLILQDSNKLYYLLFSQIYASAYQKRLQIIKQYHPDISVELCQHALTLAEQYPADEQPILPWQITQKAEENTWQADLFSMRVVYKHFITAFYDRQKPFADIIDAEIYARISEDDKAIITFSEIRNSYKYAVILMNNINKTYQQRTGKSLSDSNYQPIYAQRASIVATQAYRLGTVSALMQIKELYPKVFPKIEAHMTSYIKLQLSTLEQDKNRLNEAFNKH